MPILVISFSFKSWLKERCYCKLKTNPSNIMWNQVNLKNNQRIRQCLSRGTLGMKGLKRVSGHAGSCHLGYDWEMKAWSCHLVNDWERKAQSCHLGNDWEMKAWSCHLGNDWEMRMWSCHLVNDWEMKAIWNLCNAWELKTWSFHL